MLRNTAKPKQPDKRSACWAAALVTTVQWPNAKYGMPVRIWLPLAILCGIVLISAVLVIPAKRPMATSAEYESAGVGRLDSTSPTAESDAHGPNHFLVRFEKELLTVKADRARLEDLMKEISRRAYIAIELGEGLADRRISAEFSHLPLEAGLREILAGYDVFTYHRGDRGLLTVWVYGKLEGRGLFPVPFETWASTADLQERLRDPDAEERAAALEALLDRGGSISEQEVIEALDDVEERIRTVALYEALQEGLDLPPDRLTDLAANDSSHNVRFLALRNLAGQPAEERAIEAALNDPNPVVRSYAESTMLRLYPGGDAPGSELQQNSTQ